MYFSSQKRINRRPRMEDDCRCAQLRTKGMFFSDLFIIAVADGVGQCARSDEAASLALLYFFQDCLRFLFEEEEAFAGAADAAARKQLIGQWCETQALQNVNRQLLATFPPDERIGTTLSAAIAFDGQAFLCAAGDSPVYLLRGDVPERQLELDHLEGRRSMLTQCLGMPDILPHYKSFPLQTGDLLLAGSDGAFGTLDDDAIGTCLAQGHVQERGYLLRLFDEAARETEDNQAAALLCIDGLWQTLDERGNSDELI